MIRAFVLAGIAPFVCSAAAFAQHMDHRMMPGMTMPKDKPAAKPKAAPAPTRKSTARKTPARKTPAKRTTPPAANPHAGHAMPGMMTSDTPAADPHAGHAMPGMEAPIGTDLAPGDKPAPAPSTDHLADRYWGADAMAASRETDLRREHGGMTFYQIMFNLAEYQARKGGDGYRWDGEAWVGGDIDRLWLKSEGEGRFGGSPDAEVQALYGHAVDPYWNVQVGVRQDVGPGPSRTYATLGIEGLAPYWFDVEGAVFLSDKGDMLARVEGYYDQRITNSVTLQPRIEANLSAQDVPENGTGSGLTDLEAGLRLRYEGRREFAPYVGVSWERQFGDTARFTRARGDDTGGFSVVAGVRTWF